MNMPAKNIIPFIPISQMGCMGDCSQCIKRHSCKSGGKCKCGGKCKGLSGENAHGVTNPNATGERAKAFVNWVKNTSVRTAGGQYIGQSDLVEFVQQVHQMNIDIAKEVLRYSTTPGIVYSIYQAGKSTKTQIENRMATDPQFKQQVQDVTKKVLSTGENVWNTIVDPIKGVSTTISMLPWIIGIGLALFALYAFQNPGSVSTPRRISLT